MSLFLWQVIFCAVWDPKPQLRESAVNAVRMALWVTSQRETSAAVRQQGQSAVLYLIGVKV